MSHTVRSEYELAERLALTRWGPTGFVCPHCGHTVAGRIKSRPRVRQCRGCHRQVSVTSGTLLQGTHLPLEVWDQHGGLLAKSTRIPTMSELASALGVARSTAWQLTQKMLFAAEQVRLVVQGDAYSKLRCDIPVRPPVGPAMTERAPAHVREIDARQRNNPRSRTLVPVTFDLVGDHAAVAGVAEPPDPLGQTLRRRIDRHHPLGRWMWSLLGPRQVSLRWLPRWLQGEMAAWNLGRGVHPPPWEVAATRCGPAPLRTLDPWLSPVPPLPPPTHGPTPLACDNPGPVWSTRDRSRPAGLRRGGSGCPPHGRQPPTSAVISPRP